MTRGEITKMLTDRLICERLTDRKYYATEVTIDCGTNHEKRVDLMQFIPSGVSYASDIEKGIFVCYEVKSCVEDVFSGHGLNFLGEKNYIVTTAEVYRKVWLDDQGKKLHEFLMEKHPGSSMHFGFIILLPSKCFIDPFWDGIPKGEKILNEINNPTPLDEDAGWQTYVVYPCHQGRRTRSTTELLFCMLRSGH